LLQDFSPLLRPEEAQADYQKNRQFFSRPAQRRIYYLRADSQEQLNTLVRKFKRRREQTASPQEAVILLGEEYNKKGPGRWGI
jgi:hypothetical protein